MCNTVFHREVSFTSPRSKLPVQSRRYIDPDPEEITREAMNSGSPPEQNGEEDR